MKSKKLRIRCIVILIAGMSCVFTGCRKDKIITPKPEITAQFFSKTFGGDMDDHFGDIVKTSDGGYVMVGATSSANGTGDIPSTPTVAGNQDILIVKVGVDGSNQWVTTIGGDNNDVGRAIVVCPDGSGFMIAGYSASSSSGDIPVTRGAFDMIVVKLDLSGRKQWIKTFGGYGSDEAHGITVSPDGQSFLIAGSTTTDNDGDIPPIHPKLFPFFSEIIILSLTGDGTLQWIKNYGGNMAEDVRSIIVTPGGSGYILAGYTSSDNSGDIPPTHDRSNGLSDMLILKIGLDGNKQWVKTFGGKGFDFATGVAIKQGGNYIIGAITESNNTGDIPITHGESDMVAIELDAAGNKIWLNTYGGSDVDDAFAISAFPGGDFLITGFTATNNNGDIPQNHAKGIDSMDLLIVRIRPDGSKRWIRSYGGGKNDQGFAAVINSDKSFVIGGLTSSNKSFDIPTNKGKDGTSDGWIIKLAPE